MEEKLQEITEAYDRFRYYQDTFDGVYIYNNYDKDLNTILDFTGAILDRLEDIIDA